MSDGFQILVKDVMAKPVTIAKSAFVSEALERCSMRVSTPSS